LDEALRLWNAAEIGDTVVIPLIITPPEITTDSLSGELFADCLAQKSTTLSGSTSARINNITKACASINGIVLNPGEEFSYNNALGQRTEAAGYQAAGAYSNGQVVSEIGGGICQVSSTLYYCTLYSNLKITARTCHYFPVTYLPSGLDAAVSWGSPDFKFVNNRDFPIKIEAYTDMSSYTATVKIWGTDVDGSYVQMTTDTWATSEGTGATSYRSVYDKNGNLISKTKEADSTYHYHTNDDDDDEEEEASPSPSPSATPTAEPSPSPTPSATPTAEPSPSPTPTPTTPVATDPVLVVTDPPTQPASEDGAD
jgi:vancomycin resistance protein YoaR